MKTNNKFNPYITLGLGFYPGPHWWDPNALNHCAIQAPIHFTVFISHTKDHKPNQRALFAPSLCPDVTLS